MAGPVSIAGNATCGSTRGNTVKQRACKHGTMSAMADDNKEVFVLGVTKEGHTFRPSDWAERLAGAMSSFRPGGVRQGANAFIGYSPYCVPRIVAGIKCVIVNAQLRGLEPMAWDFVMNFAKDNHLRVAASAEQVAQQQAAMQQEAAARMSSAPPPRAASPSDPKGQGPSAPRKN